MPGHALGCSPAESSRSQIILSRNPFKTGVCIVYRYVVSFNDTKLTFRLAAPGGLVFIERVIDASRRVEHE